MEKGIEARRGDIVKIAYDMFSAKGFAQTQITLIAERAHVSTATIYKLFESKEHLFLAAYEFALDQLEAYVRSGVEHENPVEGLYVIARSYAALCDSPLVRRIVRMQIAQNGDFGDPSRAEGYRLRELVETWFQPILSRCAREGYLNPADIGFAHALITGFIEHQTLIYGLVINENKAARWSGSAVADEAVNVALLAYGKKARRPSINLAEIGVVRGLPPELAHL